MIIMRGKFLKKCLRKYRELSSGVVKRKITGLISKLEMWVCFLSSPDYSVPKDVPRGHLVVYVGEEECKRFVTKVSLLNHPLFQALLDQAEQVFQFPPSSSKLCIPCKEHVFLSVLQCIGSERDRRFSNCLFEC